MKKLTFLFMAFAFIALFTQCNKDDDVPSPTVQNVTGLIATPGDGEVTLSWTAPTSGTVKEYSISYEPGGSIITETQSPVTVGNLNNGLEYTFTVKTRDNDDNLSSGVTVSATPIGAGGNDAIPFLGNVDLLSQADVNAWEQDYTYIQGNLTIQGDDITDLSPLMNIDSVIGKLKVQICPMLESLEGLNGIQQTANSFVIWDNDALTDISALSQLTSIGADLSILFNDNLENLNGLDNLENVGTQLYIGVQGWKNPPEPGSNPALVDFCGLTNLATQGSIGAEIYIGNNAYNPTIEQIGQGECQGDGSVPQDVFGFSATAGNGLVDLAWDLPSDPSITAFVISHTPDDMMYEIDATQTAYTIENLINGTEYTITIQSKNAAGALSAGVSVMSTPGSDTFEGNAQFGSQADVDAWDPTYTKINGKLQFFGDDITDLSALSNIDTVFGKLEFIELTALTSLNGLNVEYVGSNLYMADNSALTDLSALSSLTFVGKDFVIIGNSALESLDGFDNLIHIERDIHIGVEGWQNPPVEHGNALLDDFCGLKNCFANGYHGGDYFVDYNMSNPGKDDIVTNCN